MWVSSNGERPNKSCRVETYIIYNSTIERFVVDRSTKNNIRIDIFAVDRIDDKTTIIHSI